MNSIEIFNQKRLSGTSKIFKQDTESLSNTFNDKVESIKVEGENTWLSYENFNYKGRLYILPPYSYQRPDDWGGKGNNLSSFKLLTGAGDFQTGPLFTNVFPNTNLLDDKLSSYEATFINVTSANNSSPSIDSFSQAIESDWESLSPSLHSIKNTLIEIAENIFTLITDHSDSIKNIVDSLTNNASTLQSQVRSATNQLSQFQLDVNQSIAFLIQEERELQVEKQHLIDNQNAVRQQIENDQPTFSLWHPIDDAENAWNALKTRLDGELQALQNQLTNEQQKYAQNTLRLAHLGSMNTVVKSLVQPIQMIMRHCGSLSASASSLQNHLNENPDAQLPDLLSLYIRSILNDWQKINNQ